MNLSLSLESQFEVSKLKLYLQQYPEASSQLAIEHFIDFLALVREYKKLQARYDLLELQYSEFVLSSLIESKPNAQLEF